MPSGARSSQQPDFVIAGVTTSQPDGASATPPRPGSGVSGPPTGARARATSAEILTAAAVMTCTAGLAPIYFAIRPDRLIALWLTLAAAVNVGANFLVVPTFGMNGAASVTLATQVLLSAFLFTQTLPSRVASDLTPGDERDLRSLVHLDAARSPS